MSQNDFDAFRMAVLADPALQETLREVTDYERFVELTKQLGSQQGYSFTAEDIQTAYQQSKLAWIGRHLDK